MLHYSNYVLPISVFLSENSASEILFELNFFSVCISLALDVVNY